MRLDPLFGLESIASGAVPFCGRGSIGISGDFAYHSRRALEPPAMLGMLRNPRISCRGTKSPNPSPSSDESSANLGPSDGGGSARVRSWDQFMPSERLEEYAAEHYRRQAMRSR